MPPSITVAEASLFSDYVARLAGIVVDERKRYLFESRLGEVLSEFGCTTWSELYARAKAGAGGPVERRIVDALSTHETFFFREPKAFDLVRNELAPAVFAAGGVRTLSIWSAGCSTGQEAYSLAMALAPLVAERPGRALRILGSDVSSGAVEAARRGEFTALELARGLDPALAARHFTLHGGRHRIDAALRAVCRFEVDNLLAPRAAGPFDLIFCRNVLIYFTAEDKARVLDALVDRLSPGGALVVGSAECILGVGDRVQRVERRGATYYALRP